MLLAQVEQTDDRLVIIPKRPAVGKTLTLVAWAVAGFVCCLAYAHFVKRDSLVALWPLFYAAFLMSVAGAVIVQHLIQQGPKPMFVFDRTKRRISRDARFLGPFSHLVQVCLFKREMKDGRRLQLVLIMTNFGGWTIAETYVRVPESSLVSLGDGRPQPWEVYPRDRFPADEAECELVILANLIHDYVGLKEPAPCRHFASSASKPLNMIASAQGIH